MHVRLARMLFQAGMTSEDHPERLLIALEPEAASIYVRKLRLYQLVPETPVTQTLGRSSSSATRVNRYSYVPDTTVAGIISTSTLSSVSLWSVVCCCLLECTQGPISLSSCHCLTDYQRVTKTCGIFLWHF